MSLNNNNVQSECFLKAVFTCTGSKAKVFVTAPLEIDVSRQITNQHFSSGPKHIGCGNKRLASPTH